MCIYNLPTCDNLTCICVSVKRSLRLLSTFGSDSMLKADGDDLRYFYKLMIPRLPPVIYILESQGYPSLVVAATAMAIAAHCDPMVLATSELLDVYLKDSSTLIEPRFLIIMSGDISMKSTTSPLKRELYIDTASELLMHRKALGKTTLVSYTGSGFDEKTSHDLFDRPIANIFATDPRKLNTNKITKLSVKEG